MVFCFFFVFPSANYAGPEESSLFIEISMCILRRIEEICSIEQLSCTIFFYVSYTFFFFFVIGTKTRHRFIDRKFVRFDRF